MPKVLIVGYGNPLRGDDGVGWVIAERLRRLLPPEIVTVQTHVQLVPELAVDLSKVDLVVFVDARAAEPFGAISCECVDPLLPSSAFSHHSTPNTLLAYAQQFFGKVPQAFLVSINGSDFGYREGLSPSVQASVPKAIEVISNLIGEFLASELGPGSRQEQRSAKVVKSHGSRRGEFR